MRTLGLLAGMMASMLVLFLVASWCEVPLLTDPAPWLDRVGRAGAAAASAGLLAADVILPVPASLLMIANGALFGIAGGTLVSLAGSLAGAAAGFAIGRRWSASLHRWLPEDERRRADRLLARWGELAVVLTRPVPILAESLAILAGTSPTLSWWRFLLAALLGNLPPSLLYAVTGATAARLDSALLVFALVMAVAALGWQAGRRLRRREDGEDEPVSGRRESARP